MFGCLHVVLFFLFVIVLGFEVGSQVNSDLILFCFILLIWLVHLIVGVACILFVWFKALLACVWVYCCCCFLFGWFDFKTDCLCISCFNWLIMVCVIGDLISWLFCNACVLVGLGYCGLDCGICGFVVF